jgi:cytochrome c-type biogenesis protein CcmH/NrfG
MGRHFFSAEAHTPADDVREALSDAERLVAGVRKAGPEIVELLHLLDRIAEDLERLEAGGMDVRVERSRFGAVQSQLERHKGRFLARAGEAFKEAREAAQPEQAHWWWFIDAEWREERKQRIRRVLIVGAVVVFLLVVGVLVHEFFIAPPPEIRQAMKHESGGERLARDEGNLEAALAEFETAAELNPDKPSYWVWIGVLRMELEDADAAEEAFAAARSLYETNFDFLLARAWTYRDLGDLDAAAVDVEQAILENPDSGWGYYARHAIAVSRGDYQAALDDLEKASELAQASGDVELEAMARIQRAMVLQMLSVPSEPTSEP